MARKKDKTKSTAGGAVSTNSREKPFKAPIQGLEDFHFTDRTSMAAAEFSDT